MNIQAKLKEMRERCEAADRLVCDLASGKKKWNMCVPPQKDDTDMVLIEPVRTDMPALLSALEVCLEALEECNGINMRQYGTVEAFQKPAQQTSGTISADLIHTAIKKVEAILLREGK